ncbi:conserved hypothetical protein [Pediculus humanus corporis]|uniref:TBC1 domain family member 31 n=1 Tax=Pediculus humanus subsp. corporis TaxID=121224 RepID=E0VAJ5_PEDHC|nr:uncharacterized protein Phum_PHUM039560 [Pediculus humanus corporis]EEB10401.1 conserved hypothetical protein [Pediculus humanus corporis]
MIGYIFISVTIIVGIGGYKILETGFITGSLPGHTAPATDVSYTDDGFYCLTFNNLEAIVWNMSTYDQIHVLSLKVDCFIKKVLFIPITNYILACFEDETINVWQFGTFECIKQIIPETSKTQYIKTIAISKNGKIMVIGGHTGYLVIYCLETWVVKKIIEFPESISGAKQLEFVPQVFDGGSNDILAILTTSLEFSTGKYFASVLNGGKINIYLTEVAITKKDCLKKNLNVFTEKTGSEISESQNSFNQMRKTQKYTQSLNDVRSELKKVLSLKKLHPILKQFGEFPEFYRTLIWKTILQLPENQDAFLSLATKTCHPSYTNLEAKYPLHNKSLCNSLKKLLSSLSYWCPLFGEVDFLPEFIFPFVKLFHTDLVGCFETVATIIVNWCQNWFEFYPFPPVNMLSTLENILGHHEPDLLEFYLKNDITINVFACSIFHSAFSEVLSKTDWLRLWDHILSNEPSFLFMAIIAYNINCRNAIKCIKNRNDIEKFFRSPNPIDITKLISRTYILLKETPDEIHCRHFFTSYQPLSSGGTYVSFFAYPKLIDSNVTRMLTLRKEEEEIIAEQMRALDMKKKLDKELLLKLEERIKSIVDEEEDRILAQRQKLEDLKQELRLKELQLLEGTRNKVLKKKAQKKRVELDRLIKDISKKKALEKTDVELLEDEKRKHYTKILKKMCQLELELGSKVIGSDVQKSRIKSNFTSRVSNKQNEENSISENSLNTLDENIKMKINQDERISKDNNNNNKMFTCQCSQKLLEESSKKKKKKKNLFEGYSFKSDSENEIFKTVLSIRRQLLKNGGTIQQLK